MDILRQTLIAQSSSPSDFKHYSLVQVTKDQVSSSGQTFRKGDLTIADPDVYMVSRAPHRAVYNAAAKAHVLLPEKEVRNVPPDDVAKP